MRALTVAALISLLPSLASGAQIKDYYDKYAEVSKLRQSADVRLKNLSAKVGEAKKLESVLLQLQGARGDKDKLAKLTTPDIAAPTADPGGVCNQMTQAVRRTRELAEQATQRGRDAKRLLDADAGADEPTAASAQNATNAANQLRQMAELTGQARNSAKTYEGLVKSVGSGRLKVDMSGVEGRQKQIAAYDALTSQLQSQANAAEGEIRQLEQKRDAALEWFVQSRSSRPADEQPAIDRYLKQVKDTTVPDRAPIDDARKLVAGSDKLVGDARFVLSSISQKREVAAQQDAELCAGVAADAERKAALQDAKSKVQALQESLEDLAAYLGVRLAKLETVKKKNDTIRERAPAELEAAKKSGTPERVKALTDVQKRSADRAALLQKEMSAINTARSGANEGKAAAGTTMNLIGVSATK